MKLARSIVFTGAIFAATGANALLLDFTAIADANEYGAASLFFSDPLFDLTITGADGSPAGTNGSPTGAFTYLDKGHAGLGVCGMLNSSAQCVPSSDDNVTNNEVLTFAFSAIAADTFVIVEKVWLNNTHDPNPSGQIASPETVLLNGVSTLAPGNGYATGNAYNNQANLNASVDNYLGGLFGIDLIGNAFTLGFDSGSNTAEQFYVSGIEISTGSDRPPADVPVPGTLLLLGIGLAGLVKSRR